MHNIPNIFTFSSRALLVFHWYTSSFFPRLPFCFKWEWFWLNFMRNLYLNSQLMCAAGFVAGTFFFNNNNFSYLPHFGFWVVNLATNSRGGQSFMSQICKKWKKSESYKNSWRSTLGEGKFSKKWWESKK